MKLRITLPLAILFCLCIFVEGQESPETHHLQIDLAGPSRPFPHFWEQMFGSGRAILSLRESYRRDLRMTRAATGFRYVRFHGILDDEVGVYDEDSDGHPLYNWSYVDQIYDGLLADGVRPFVELSFMPAKLAASLQWHAFWYKPLPSPPKDYSKWEQLIGSFAQHLVERYGIDEVSQWYFEVWNEPNIDFWTGQPKQSTYFELYDTAARSIKRVNSQLRVGGPATAQAAWIPAMIDHVAGQNVPLDFVSTHVYANDRAQDIFGTDENIPRVEMVARAVRKVYAEVKASARPDTPILWTEYNASYKNEVDVTDSAFMGPWLANNIRQCDGLTTLMSYWTFSDVFEEQGVVKRPFYGGYGLIAEGGVPKAAFNAFAMLHQLGDERLQPDLEDAIVTRRKDGSLAIAVWNYADPGETGPSRTYELALSHSKGRPRFHVQIVDENRGSALERWRAMGSPQFPTKAQYDSLRRSATETEQFDAARFTLPAHGLALVRVQSQ